MTTPTNNSQMHNDIMAAGSKEPKQTTTSQEVVHEHTVLETHGNTTPKKCSYIDAKAETIHMILSGIEDDIYSTVDAFLQQLQPEWSRFVTVVKQTSDFDTISYHKLFDILKKYRNEVNDIRAEKIARNANPLALVAATQ
ncbi:hypothetical protein Tco_1429846 [Tanacetum coccineum]